MKYGAFLFIKNASRNVNFVLRLMHSDKQDKICSNFEKQPTTLQKLNNLKIGSFSFTKKYFNIAVLYVKDMKSLLEIPFFD